MPRIRQSRNPSPAHPEWGIQVRPFAVGFTEAYKFDRKRYDWDGLIYASEGVMSIQTAKGSWVVPPHRAVWVPAGVEHSTEVSPGLSLRTLFFRPRLLKTLPRDCCVVNVPPLLRELILHTVEIGMLNRTIPSHARLIGVLRDQIEILGVSRCSFPAPLNRALAASRSCSPRIPAIPRLWKRSPNGWVQARAPSNGCFKRRPGWHSVNGASGFVSSARCAC